MKAGYKSIINNDEQSIIAVNNPYSENYFMCMINLLCLYQSTYLITHLVIDDNPIIRCNYSEWTTNNICSQWEFVFIWAVSLCISLWKTLCTLNCLFIEHYAQLVNKAITIFIIWFVVLCIFVIVFWGCYIMEQKILLFISSYLYNLSIRYKCDNDRWVDRYFMLI